MMKGIQLGLQCVQYLIGLMVTVYEITEASDIFFPLKECDKYEIH